MLHKEACLSDNTRPLYSTQYTILRSDGSHSACQARSLMIQTMLPTAKSIFVQAIIECLKCIVSTSQAIRTMIEISKLNQRNTVTLSTEKGWLWSTVHPPQSPIMPIMTEQWKSSYQKPLSPPDTLQWLCKRASLGNQHLPCWKTLLKPCWRSRRLRFNASHSMGWQSGNIWKKAIQIEPILLWFHLKRVKATRVYLGRV